MATLTWDKPGERIYQTGVDHGVLYLRNNVVVPWNGLISVDESPNPELKTFFLDGVKYLQILVPGDYLGTLKAFTYPDEFDEVNGVAAFAPGLVFYDQPAKSFNLSYQTKIGDDLKAEKRGYKIHLLYNVLATPNSYSFETANDSGASPVEFSWSLTGTPVKINKIKPTVHVAIDSTKTPPDILAAIEAKLYGTVTSNPSFPSIIEIAEFFGYLGALIIVDYGDGTWSAIDESGTYIVMNDPTTFTINHADATYLDAVTYDVSSTNVDI